MKKCEQFRDLILTDYIDGQLAKDAAGSVESHLLDCSECRAFFKDVKNNALSPLQAAMRQPVPTELWAAIRQNIEHENQRARPLVDFIDKVKETLVFPRLVPVFASLVVMLLAGSVTLNTIQVGQAKDKDQGEYLVSLLSPADTSSDSSDLGTSIEHYFL